VEHVDLPRPGAVEAGADEVPAVRVELDAEDEQLQERVEVEAQLERIGDRGGVDEVELSAVAGHGDLVGELDRVADEAEGAQPALDAEELEQAEEVDGCVDGAGQRDVA